MTKHDEKSEIYQAGMDQIRKQFGDMGETYINSIKEFSEEFAWVNVTFPFAELYPRKVIDLKTRELCTISALTVLGYAENELRLHINAALKVGATKQEIIEIMIQMIAYCGFPAASNALFIARNIFESTDSEKK